MSTLFRNAFLMLFLSLTLVVAGCDSDSNDDDNGSVNGTFSAEITGGGIDGALEGPALFGIYEDEELDETFFAIYLTPTQTTGSQSIVLMTRGNRPGTGTYSIIDFTDEEVQDIPAGSFAALVIGGSVSSLFSSTGGTITLSSSSTNRVGGTFSFNAAGVSFVNGEVVETSVSASGSFNAVGGQNFQIPGL